jgi:GNAT superfamily N-acetyltransferase
MGGMAFPPGTRIRRAWAEEWPAVATTLITARRAAVPSVPPSVHSDDEVTCWVRDVLMIARQVWVADSAGCVLAVMALGDGWIDQLYVDAEWTGRGLGSALVDHAKAEAGASLDLWTFASNTRAQRFYERHGFVEVDRTDGENEEGEPDICYRWSGGPGGDRTHDRTIMSRLL